MADTIVQASYEKCHLTRVIFFTVNYCYFANDDVSIRFYGKTIESC